MSGPSGWPGGDDAETQVLALPAAERQILAALAVVGRATLSADELADLVEVDDVIPLIEDLELRKLIRRDEKRYSAIEHVGEQIRNTNEALATGDRVLGYFKTLAAAGALTPQRLADDSEAILGISEWAAEHQQWAGLLELVMALQATFGIAHRVREWLILLGRGRAAAQALGDIHSEIWMLEQLATATAGAGDASSAQRYLREADQLQHGSAPVATRDVRPPQAAAAGAAGGGATGVPRVLLWIGGLVLAAVIGAGLGFAIGDDNSPAGSTTAPVPVTITEPGTTLTTEATVTLPASTVVTTATATETTTTFVTTTVVGVP